MKKNNFILIGALLLSSQSVLADEIMSCPAVSDLSSHVGTYTSNDGKWFGQSTGRENTGNIKAFKEAIYIVEKNEKAFGRLSKCIYSLDVGSVDMLFTDERQKRNKGLYVSLPGEGAWREDPEGSFLNSYTCTSSNVEDCLFNRLTDAEIVAHQAENSQ